MKLKLLSENGFQSQGKYDLDLWPINPNRGLLKISLCNFKAEGQVVPKLLGGFVMFVLR